MYEEEIEKLLELLATIIEVSLVSHPEIEDWAELKPGVLRRMLKREKDIPLHSLFLILECVTFDPRSFFSIGGMVSKPGTPWRDQVLRKLREIGYGPVVFLPGERPAGSPRF